MATNQMRREAAKRKLARQRERQAAQARRRRQLTVIGSVAAVVVVLVGVVLFATLGQGTGTPRRPRPRPRPKPRRRPPPQTPAAIPTAAAPLPKRPTALPATVNCSFPASGQAARPVKPPAGTNVSAQGTVGVTLQTGDGRDRPHPGQGPRAVHGGQLRQPHHAGLLRQHHLPPDHHRARPAGAAVRRPDRHGLRRPRLHDPGRGVPRAEVRPRDPRDGEHRPAQLGRQPVLHDLRRRRAAPAVHGVRFDHARRPAGARHDREARLGRLAGAQPRRRQAGAAGDDREGRRLGCSSR